MRKLMKSLAIIKKKPSIIHLDIINFSKLIEIDIYMQKIIIFQKQ